MIFNNFLNKTIETAKLSALQIYGYDFTELKGILHHPENRGEQSGSHRERRGLRQHPADQPSQHRPYEGVTFERSGIPKPARTDTTSLSVESKLAVIREYAARQMALDVEEINTVAGGKRHKTENEIKDRANMAPQAYSRKDIRKQSSDSQNNQAVLPGKTDRSIQTPDRAPAETIKKTTKGNFFPTKAGGPKTSSNENQNLRQRLERLESLMHLSLTSDDLNYATHPAFHKLLHKGVPRRLISKWFHTISEQGIDPSRQEKLFNTKLSLMIREVLSKARAKQACKLLLFTGRAGAGKTHLIMKLSQHAGFVKGKNIAAASIEPTSDEHPYYYSILPSYCKDHDIPFYRLQDTPELEAASKEWEAFDHILVDTPAIEMIDELFFERFMALKKRIASLYESETHYLINTAVSGVAFNDPLAIQLDADHLALTHLDQSNKWGKTVQLLEQTDYSLRFISNGASIRNSIETFKAKQFTEQLIR